MVEYKEPAVQIAFERSTSMRAQVYDFLRQRIVRGHLLPRTPLSEKDFSDQLGVSRTPVREALLRLGDEGLIDIIPQVGTFVAPIRTQEVLDSQFVREALETAAIRKAAELLTRDDVIQLRKILELQRFRQSSGDSLEFFAADEAMHEKIFSIARHPAAWSVVISAKQQLDRVRHLVIKRPTKLRSVLDEHNAVIEALIARDGAAAADAMRLHLRGVFASLEMLTAENPEYFASDGERPTRRAPISITRKASN